MDSTVCTRPRAKAKAKYNPNAVRRRERLVEVDASNIAHLLCYSLTRKSQSAGQKDIEHRIEIDLQTGEARCSCEHFHHVCSKQTVTVSNAATAGCKHIHRAIGILKRHSLLRLDLKPAQAVQMARVETGGTACPKCQARLIELAGRPYCLICEENFNL